MPFLDETNDQRPPGPQPLGALLVGLSEAMRRARREVARTAGIEREIEALRRLAANPGATAK